MTETRRLISLDHSTTPGLSPMQTIALAHELACDAVSLRMDTHPDYPDTPYDIVNDAALRRSIRDEVAARGMFVALGTAFGVSPGMPVASLRPALDAAADMGARAVSVVVYDRDKMTHLDRVGELAELSGQAGVRALLEFFALSGLDSLPYTVSLIERIGNPALGMGADILHVVRTGATTAQLAAVPAGLIGHSQISDGPLHMPVDKQLHEARAERMLPGDGEFDLIGFVRALPPNVPIGLEVPSYAQFERGVTMEERARAAVSAARRVIAEALAV